MLAWVYEAAASAQVFHRLIVATDSEEVADVCRQRGWEARLTSPALNSGTDRVHAVAQQLAEENPSPSTDTSRDIFVNIQGDEPLLRPEHFHALLRPFARTGSDVSTARPEADVSTVRPEVDVSTIMTRCPAEGIQNPNVVKVVVAQDGRALYFSRATIPWDRDSRGDILYWKHLGLYAYRRHVLDRFARLPVSRLEAAEKLEQLRLLENGIAIYVEPVEFDTVGVDTEADLAMAAELLSQRST